MEADCFIPVDSISPDEGKHQMKVLYTPLDEGKHEVFVTVKGEAIPFSPFQLVVDGPRGVVQVYHSTTTCSAKMRADIDSLENLFYIKKVPCRHHRISLSQPSTLLSLPSFVSQPPQRLTWSSETILSLETRKHLLPPRRPYP